MNTARNLYKIDSMITRGNREGLPVYTRGSALKFLGFPVRQNGAVDLTGTVITFEGSFDGTAWFGVLDPRGVPISIVPSSAKQLVIPQNSMQPAPAILPVDRGILFEGIQMVRPVSNLAEMEDRKIEFYVESSIP